MSEETTQAEETSLSDDLHAAFDAAEAPEVKETQEEVSAASEETEEQRAERARDEKGRFAKKEAQEAAEKAPAAPAQPAAAAPPPKETPAAAAPPQEAYKPPQSWKPTTREEWSKLPPAVQEEVTRRERETAKVLSETAEARQMHQKMREVTAPYEHMFRAEGGDPLKGYESYLRQAALLRTAPPQTKAEAIAGLIAQFLPGPDGVQLLDAALTARLSGQPAASAAPQEFRDPRLDGLLAQFEQQKAAREAEMAERAKAALQEIQVEEFFEDVKLDMADILEVASRRGLTMTAKEAYNRAVALHPEISKVLEQRKAASASALPHGSTQKARLAASSVRSSPTAAKPAQSGGSLKDDLEAAFAAAEGGRR